MNQTEAVQRFAGLSAERQIQVLAACGHNLTIAARDTYEVQASGVRAPQRLRDINEIQHRLFAHIGALVSPGAWRYPDDSLLAIVFEQGDKHLQAQTLWAFENALQVAAA